MKTTHLLGPDLQILYPLKEEPGQVNRMNSLFGIPAVCVCIRVGAKTHLMTHFPFCDFIMGLTELTMKFTQIEATVQ